ncbi:MAG: MlaD family protein [Gemmatimonadota bacterium]|nr:MlaD family protein [Gemmatimonadota bacterium]
MRDPGLRSQQKVELQVGAMLVLAGIALVAGVIWISGAQPGVSRTRLYATAATAGALGEGSRITLLGVDVGSVQQIDLRPEGVVLSLDVRYEGRLPADTEGEIRSEGFLGQAALALLPGISERTLAEGDTIPASGAPGLQDLAGTLGADAGRVLDQLRQLLNDTTVDATQRGLVAFAGGMEELDALLQDQSDDLARLIEGLAVTSQRLSELSAGPELESTLAQIDSLTARLSRASDDLDETSRALASILGKVDRGEGSLGRMVNDTTLYVRLNGALSNLEAASEEIALLTRDVRERPEHYTKGLKFSVF